MVGQFGRIWEVLGVCTRLGLTSFGGPIAHLGYFRQEYVERRKWLNDKDYADLVALCQFLPGPASSQVGMAMGLFRAGPLGAIAAWLGFTLPSAIALMIFAMLTRTLDVSHASWLHGMLLMAVAVVSQAVWGMAKNLTPDKGRATLAVLAAISILLWPSAWTQVLVLLVGGMIGKWLIPARTFARSDLEVPVTKRVGAITLTVFFILLFGLPILGLLVHSHMISFIDRFYRAGALVFGGGHVVLPLLQQSVVTPGWVTNSQFLAGYGAAQAVPGPLFTFSAYLGSVSNLAPNGWLGGFVALISIFLPAFLLVVGVLPFWNEIRTRPGFQSALAGVNATVVGILAAALYNPVFVSAVHSSVDFCIALGAFLLLVQWRVPPWLVVLTSVLAAWALHG